MMIWKQKSKDFSNSSNILIYCIYKTMLWYCLKFRKNTDIKNPKVVKSNKGRIMPSWKCTVCDSKKSRFIKE